MDRRFRLIIEIVLTNSRTSMFLLSRHVISCALARRGVRSGMFEASVSGGSSTRVGVITLEFHGIDTDTDTDTDIRDVPIV